MKKSLRYIPLILFAVVAIFFFYSLEIRKTKPVSELASALIDRPFPDYQTSELITQSPINRGRLVNGTPTLVNVWASWCGACRIEHPFLKTLADSGVRIVGVNYKDDRQDALRWLNQYTDIAEFHIVDPDGRLGINLGVYGAPETYLIDAQGFIRFKQVGVVTPEIWQEISPLYRRLMEASTNAEI